MKRRNYYYNRRIVKCRNIWFQLAYWIFLCIFFLTGCSENHSMEEKTSVEVEKEETEEEKTERSALENKILDSDNSTRIWSGEKFWNEDWNKDIDFSEAFHTSCVWYYRQLIDDIGKDMMQKELDKLQYGNCDISDWEGRLNTNNDNRALTGFWIESSLMISPKEQVEVMERIFGEKSDYSEETQNELKKVMLVSEKAGVLRLT